MKRKFWLIPVIVIGLVLFLFVLIFCMSKLFGREANYEKEKVLMEQGPWSSEAIWMDSSSQMYLVCNKDSNNQYADVVAYLSVDGQWCSTQLHLNQGAPVVSFVTEDGERVLEARVRMNKQKLQLYKFKTYDEKFTLQYTDIKLSKFLYQEQIEKLPFEIIQ